jgi:hypothetical protein
MIRISQVQGYDTGTSWSVYKGLVIVRLIYLKQCQQQLKSFLTILKVHWWVLNHGSIPRLLIYDWPLASNLLHFFTSDRIVRNASIYFNNATTLFIPIEVTQHSLHTITYLSVISNAVSVFNVRRSFVTGFQAVHPIEGEQVRYVLSPQGS